jgi:hypothetical protein
MIGRGFYSLKRCVLSSLPDSAPRPSQGQAKAKPRPSQGQAKAKPRPSQGQGQAKAKPRLSQGQAKAKPRPSQGQAKAKPRPRSFASAKPMPRLAMPCHALPETWQGMARPSAWPKPKRRVCLRHGQGQRHAPWPEPRPRGNTGLHPLRLLRMYEIDSICLRFNN